MAERRGKASVRGGKRAILDAAVDNSQRLGSHGTSMLYVARGADITVVSIYHHFPSKQDIMVRVLSDVISGPAACRWRPTPPRADQFTAVVRA